MKRLLIVCCLTALLGVQGVFSAAAQDRFADKGQWSVDFGIAPFSSASLQAMGDAVANPIAQIFATIFTFGLYEPEKNYDEYHLAPGLSLRANYQVNHWLSVCGDLNGCWARFDRIHEKDGPVLSKDHWGSLAFVPGVRFTYLNRRHVMLFSGLSLGVGYLFSDHGDDAGLFPAFEIVPLGVTFGGRVYGTFELNSGSEFGISCRGGIGYRF